MIPSSYEWLLGAKAMQLLFALAAFGWAFIWFHRQRIQHVESDFGPFDMTFAELAGRVAFESKWGRRYDPSQWPYWQKNLKREIYSKLTTGQLKSQGIKADKSGEDNGPTVIEADFWAKANFNAEFLLWNALGGEPWTCAFTDEDTSRWRDNIMFQREAVNRTWPRAFVLCPWRRKSPFEQWVKEWYAEQQETATHGLDYYSEFLRQAGKSHAENADQPPL